jgi:Protein of unknown function (DUF3619)
MKNATTLRNALQTPHFEAMQDRIGLKVAARLNEPDLPHDISERLRVARQQALAQRKPETQLQTATNVTMSGGAAVLGGGPLSWWGRMGYALPFLALIAGLVAIDVSTDDDGAREIAEIDTQLLTDELPPSAHTDAGFAQFLKYGPPNSN